MSEISASAVMALRQKTGVSMMECKKALSEANGDEAQAIEILRKKGAAKAANKADRATSEGVVAISGNAIVSVHCETDFVARSDDFMKFAADLAAEAQKNGAAAAEQKFENEKAAYIAKLGENLVFGQAQVVSGDTIGAYLHSNRKVGALVALSGGSPELGTEIAMHVTAMNPAVLSPDEVSEDLVAKEKEIWADQLKQEGKPAEIVEKIMLGKEKKFREEAALVKQAFVKEPDKTVEDYAKAQGGVVSAFVRVEI